MRVTPFVAALVMVAGCYTRQEGFKYQLTLAAEGMKEAQYSVAQKYRTGTDTERNLSESLRYYKMAAENGSADAAFELGLLYQEGGEFEKSGEEAIKWYEKAGSLGKGAGYFNAAVAYDNGELVKKDVKKAFPLYKKAAELCHSDAFIGVAQAYYFGKGVKKNLSLSYHWLSSGQKLFESHHTGVEATSTDNKFPYASMFKLASQELSHKEVERINALPPIVDCSEHL